jgi:hypothetical protein
MIDMIENFLILFVAVFFGLAAVGFLRELYIEFRQSPPNPPQCDPCRGATNVLRLRNGGFICAGCKAELAKVIREAE